MRKYINLSETHASKHRYCKWWRHMYYINKFNPKNNEAFVSEEYVISITFTQKNNEAFVSEEDYMI